MIYIDNTVRLKRLLGEIIVLSMADRNEQTDADILQYKADILRARDIIPGTLPQEKKTHQNPILQSDEKTTLSSAADGETSVAEQNKAFPGIIPKAQEEQMNPVKDKAGEAVDVEQEKMQIPKFDLAEEIMAEQRKITSIRRKAPDRKTEAQSQEREVEQGPQLIGYTLEQPTPVLSGQEQIVAEIVARDIEKLCKDST